MREQELDHDEAVVAILTDIEHAAFEGHGAFDEPRDAHALRGRQSEAGARHLAHAGRQRARALDHPRRDGLVADVDDAFAVGVQVGRGVLRRAIITVGRGEHGERRLGAHDVEERERRGVDHAGGVDGRDQGDGPGDDQAREEAIRLRAGMGREVEAHAHAPGGESSPPCETMASRRRRS